jgi:hypothetical protein
MSCFSTVSHTWGNFSLTAEQLRAVESAHGCKEKANGPTALKVQFGRTSCRLIVAAHEQKAWVSARIAEPPTVTRDMLVVLT